MQGAWQRRGLPQARRWRCAWMPTAPGASSEAVAAIDALSPAGLELVEEPTHGLHAMREVREQVAVRVSIDETAGEHGALDRRSRRRDLPEDLQMRRHCRPLGSGDARARHRRRGLPRVDARWPAGDRRGRPRRSRARLTRSCWRTAAWRRLSCSRSSRIPCRHRPAQSRDPPLPGSGSSRSNPSCVACAHRLRSHS